MFNILRCGLTAIQSASLPWKILLESITFLYPDLEADQLDLKLPFQGSISNKLIWKTYQSVKLLHSRSKHSFQRGKFADGQCWQMGPSGRGLELYPVVTKLSPCLLQPASCGTPSWSWRGRCSWPGSSPAASPRSPCCAATRAAPPPGPPRSPWASTASLQVRQRRSHCGGAEQK